MKRKPCRTIAAGLLMSMAAAFPLTSAVHAASYGTQLSYNPSETSASGFDNEITKAPSATAPSALPRSTSSENQDSEVFVLGGKDAVMYTNTDFRADIFIDNQSTLKLKLENGAHMTGAVNTDNTAKSVTLTLAKDAQWILTEDSHIMSFSDEDLSFKNIQSNGHNIYYQKNASTILGGMTYDLPGGGRLMPEA